MSGIDFTVGGGPTIRAVVDEFYRRVLNDPAVSWYFVGVDTERLAEHQRAFLTAALGGPDGYTGRTLSHAHAGRGIDDGAFDTVAEHLIATLRDLHTDPETTRQVGLRLAELRPAVVAHDMAADR